MFGMSPMPVMAVPWLLQGSGDRALVVRSCGRGGSEGSERWVAMVVVGKEGVERVTWQTKTGYNRLYNRKKP
jgi:hypothetical protein